LGGKLWLMGLVGMSPVGANATAQLSLTLAADPPDPSAHQVVYITSTVTNEGPDEATVELDMETSELFERPLPGRCFTDPRCGVFCSVDAIYCELGRYPPNEASSVVVQLSSAIDFSAGGHVQVGAGACEVDASGSGLCASTPQEAEVWIPPLPPVTAPGSGGCSTGTASASGILALVLALLRRSHPGRGGCLGERRTQDDEGEEDPVHRRAPCGAVAPLQGTPNRNTSPIWVA
jgi:hypothetical protein